MKVLLAVIALITLVACSYRGAYEGIQAGNRNECSKLPPSQYEECMEKANMSYDEYEKQRQETLNDSN